MINNTARIEAAKAKHPRARELLQRKNPQLTVEQVAKETHLDHRAVRLLAGELIREGLRLKPRSGPHLAPRTPPEWVDLPCGRIQAQRQAAGLDPLTGEPV
jgi:hypothetical protein